MIGLEIRIDIGPGKRREFLQTADTLLEENPTRGTRCMDRGMFEQHGVPNQFLWHEEWDDSDSLEERLASQEFRTLLGALRVLGKTHDIRIANVERRSNPEKET